MSGDYDAASALLQMMSPSSIMCCVCDGEMDITVHTHKCFDCKKAIHSPFTCVGGPTGGPSFVDDTIVCPAFLSGIFPLATSQFADYCLCCYLCGQLDAVKREVAHLRWLPRLWCPGKLLALHAVMHVCMYVCRYVCMYVCIYAYVCVCIYVYMCACMYVFM